MIKVTSAVRDHDTFLIPILPETMPTKYQSDTGAISPKPTAEHKFPIYFCEGCEAPNAAFGVVRADGRLNYCGWENGQAVCVGKGRAEGGGKVPAPAAPW